MRTLRAILFASIAIVLPGAAFYLWPPAYADFDENYAAVDDELRRSLLEFRADREVKWATVGEHTWSYLSLGRPPGDSETIVFLHGMTGSYDIWWQQLKALEDRYHLIVPTYPAANSLGAMEWGVRRILAQEGVDEFTVVGSSLGGYLAQYIVARNPGRIRKAVFANTFPPNDIIAEKNRTIGTLLPFLPEWLIMRVLSDSIEKKVYPASGNSELVRAFGLEQTRGGHMNRAQLLARFRCVIQAFEAPDLRNSGISVMIIEADNDPLVEARLRAQLRATYPTALVHNMSGAGHFPYLNQAPEYTQLLLDFFGDAP